MIGSNAQRRTAAGRSLALPLPRDMSPRVDPRQPYNRVPQNPTVSPSPYGDQPGGQWENAPQLVWGVAEPDHRLHDTYHIDVAW